MLRMRLWNSEMLVRCKAPVGTRLEPVVSASVSRWLSLRSEMTWQWGFITPSNFISVSDSLAFVLLSLPFGSESVHSCSFKNSSPSYLHTSV